MIWEYYFYDWDLLSSFQKPKDLKDILLSLKTITNPEAAQSIIYKLEHYIMHGQELAEVSIPIIRCLLNILAERNPANQNAIADLLSVIFGGRTFEKDLAAGKPDLHKICAEEIALGFPIYLSILEDGVSGVGLDFLDLLTVSAFGNPNLTDRALQWLKAFQQNNPSTHPELVNSAIEEINSFKAST